ncbi:MAG TPA: Ku protein [Clostridiaceae bacterium]
MVTSTRTIWNGAISFGLVNIPVALVSATNEAGLDFDWIDKRTMDPVGYKRINKNTGEEIEKDNIVRGIAYEKGKYVILTDEEIRNALVKSTQTIELESFVFADEIKLEYFEKPYYLAPGKNSGKAYTLLRETLLKTKRVGIARIVIHNKQHAAAIVPEGRALVLILLRWEHQIRPLGDMELPAEGISGLSDREISMAEQLVGSMAERWDPVKLKDSFEEKVMALVHEKAQKGLIESVVEQGVEAAEASGGAEVVDFTELLKKSLQHKEVGQASKASSKAKRVSKVVEPKKAL